MSGRFVRPCARRTSWRPWPRKARTRSSRVTFPGLSQAIQARVNKFAADNSGTMPRRCSVPGSYGQTLWRVTADFRLKFAEIDEGVGLTPKVIGNHGGLGGNARYDRNAHAAALHRRHKRAKVTVTGK